MLDLPALLEPVASDSPAGPNLEDGDAFLELERSLHGKPEQQFGDTVIPAEEPDWRGVVAKASALLNASKDLRVATHLVRALVAVDSYAGFGEGLELVRGLVERYWPVLHPQLDPGDDDPTARVSAVWALTHREMLQALRAATLVRSRSFGPVTLRNLAVPGTQSPDGTPDAEVALRDVPIDDLTKAYRVVERCVASAASLQAVWESHVGPGEPDFSDLTRLLAQAIKAMKGRVDQAQATATHDAAPSSVAGDGGGAGARAGATSMRGPLDFRTRDDVVRALDAICAYYAANEPSSPVPLLLQRCKRLVTMSFLDIVKDMVPDGLSTIQTIAGKRDD